jgi:hypothetical protein
VAELSRRLTVTYPTARSDIQRLMDAKILEELPGITPKTFFSPEVFRVAYDDLDDDQ